MFQTDLLSCLGIVSPPRPLPSATLFHSTLDSMDFSKKSVVIVAFLFRFMQWLSH